MLLLLILSITTPLFTNFLDDCFYQGMIFQSWGKFVKSLGFWGKPIGGCVKCFNFWVTFFVYLVYTYAVGFSYLTFIIGFIIIIGLSNTVLDFIIEDKIDKEYD